MGQQSTNVILWAGVSPKQFTSVTVTREWDDGDQVSPATKFSSAPALAKTKDGDRPKAVSVSNVRLLSRRSQECWW
jgi:hypothetical protein